MNFYTSDLHLNHANVIKYCNRPFDDVSEMNQTIKNNWNKVVTPLDKVYILGDVGFFKDEDVFYNTLKQLNGSKVLVYGNHDKQIKKSKRLQSCFDFCTSYLEVTDYNTFVVLSHYAFRVWNKSHHGAIHLYGHSHGTLPGDSQSCDVGVDAWNFTPVTLGQIKTRLEESPSRHSVDHHKD